MPTFGNFEFNTKATLICFCFFAAICIICQIQKILSKINFTKATKKHEQEDSKINSKFTQAGINEDHN